MIWPILRKDWTLLWPLAVLVTLIQIALEWAVYKSGFYGANPVTHQLMKLLTLPWFLGLVAISVAVVHEDTIPGADQDWLVRPLVRTDLLLAKVGFVLATVCLPMLVVNFAQELSLGFPVLPSLGDALYKEAYLFVCLLAPALAIAAATRNVPELVVLAVGLVVVYAVSLWLNALLFGANRCPTCDSGLEWLQHVLQHAGVLAGSIAILLLQYYSRRTILSRWVLVIGTILLIFAQLPWNAAFAVQSWMGASRGTAPQNIQIQGSAAEMSGAIEGSRGRQESARRATQALLKGDVDAAVENLQHFRHPGEAAVSLSVPLQISGTGPDEFVAVDHAEFALLDAHGGVLYRGVTPAHPPTPLLPDPKHSGRVQQSFEIPGSLYRELRPRAVSLRVDFYLTVRTVVAEHRMAAVDGELRSPETGLCQATADISGSYVRCRNIGRTANCVGATLFGPEGRHNPRAIACSADYRPFIPSVINIISFSGVDLPVRDAYGVANQEVDSSDLPGSYIDLKIYEAGAHFKRTVVVALPGADQALP